MQAGVGAVQVREKDLGGRALFDRVARLVSLCGSEYPCVLVNDRADVALAAGARGVHLPGTGISVEALRRVVGAEALVGRSIHSAEELAHVGGANYVIFGPIFETPSKRAYGEPQGLEKLREVSRAAPVPVIAIGGITPDRVSEVCTHGASGVAVMGAILDAEDPAAVVREFREALAQE